MDLFDDLFNDFINKGKKDKKDKKDVPFISELKNLMNALSSFKTFDPEEGEEIQSQLGKPDEVQKFVENDMHFTRLIWNTPHGKFIKVVVTNDPDSFELPTYDDEPKSLEEQLEEALESEDYLLAAKLRDQINGSKKVRKGRKKVE
jgi:formylmethanofuran dehydrogenase subunit D